ncbi:hypothetical protein N658DRAFT_524323 [Parathielavia hyrcaniae]|uniref:Uncharacterized protein n=1 Tax=Parathielavia hyrcaniae TaxID=113614 RepID=A0AAN6T1G0_9PEZI|nr:hypothetical protein N658DRAFT_524323 [Parathielavia hyrcaniae]
MMPTRRALRRVQLALRQPCGARRVPLLARPRARPCREVAAAVTGVMPGSVGCEAASRPWSRYMPGGGGSSATCPGINGADHLATRAEDDGWDLWA